MDIVAAHRTELYRIPGLAGEVDGHGGDRIRQKMEQVLKKVAKDNGVNPGVVKGKAAVKRKSGDGEMQLQVVKQVKKEKI